MTERHGRARRTLARRFAVGDQVKRKVRRLPSQHKPKFAPGWEGPFIIDQIGPHDSYRLKTPAGVLERHPVNANHLAPYLVGAPGT
jgi:hypothetical protein